MAFVSWHLLLLPVTYISLIFFGSSAKAPTSPCHHTQLFQPTHLLTLLYWMNSTHIWGLNYIPPVSFLNDFSKLQSPCWRAWASLVVQMIKNLSSMRKTWVWFLDLEDPLEKRMTTHSSILPGESYAERSLAGYSPWGCKEQDMAEWLMLSLSGEHGPNQGWEL